MPKRFNRARERPVTKSGNIAARTDLAWKLSQNLASTNSFGGRPGPYSAASRWIRRSRRWRIPGVSARREGPSKRWNLATFCSTNLLGSRPGEGGAVEVPSAEAVLVVDVDDEGGDASVPKEMMRMSKDACAENTEIENVEGVFSPHT